MADIFKVIFELEAKGSGVLDEINKVKGKYVEINQELKKQEVTLDNLRRQEKKLLEDKQRASSVNAVAKLNAELKKVQSQIQITSKSVEQLNKSEKALQDTTNKFSKDLNNAFKTSTAKALDAELKKITKDFGDGADAAVEGFEKTDEKVDETAVKTKSLRTQLRELKAQLAEVDDDAEFERLSIEAGKLEDKINDASDAARVFATDSPFEAVGNAIGSVGSKLLALDFDGAAKQSQLLVKATSQITFKQAITGIGQLGTTLLNIGKALLLNPLFLLGAVIIGIIANFDKLKSQGGAVGTFFKGVDNIIDDVTNRFTDLTDAIGATTVALDELAASQGRFLDKSLALSKEIGQFRNNINKIQGKEGLKDELQNLELQRVIAQKRINLVEDENKRKGLSKRNLTKLEKEEFEKLINEEEDLRSIGFELEKKQQERLRELRRKTFSEEDQKIIEDLEKEKRGIFFKTNELQLEAAVKVANKIRDLQNEISTNAGKVKTFEAEIKLKPLSKEQIKATFDVQRAEIARQQKEEERIANLEFQDEAKRGEIIKKIRGKFGLEFKLIKLQQIKAELDAERDLAAQVIQTRQDVLDKTAGIARGELDSQKSLKEQQLDALSALNTIDTLKESDAAKIKLDIQRKYYTDLLALTRVNNDIQKKINEDNIKDLEADIERRKAKGLDTTNQERELAQIRIDAITQQKNAEIELDNFKQASLTNELVSTREINEKILAEQQKRIDTEFEHDQSRLKLKNASQGILLRSEIRFEEQRLEVLRKSGLATEAEIRSQEDKINALRKERRKQDILEYTGYTEQIIQASINAANQIIAAKLKETEKQIDLQQKRVDEARDIAENGNAELLELEQQRLDNLNKEREKFVRQQQALAVVELIANTAIAVSKAAAEGGVAAGVTIAATLIALVAGLASARQIAGQAAFFKGGYTGDGNPKDESTALGKRPYTYHKGEFVFNNETTKKNRSIFDDVHKGRIDLREWEQKVKAFDSFNMQRELNIRPEVNNNIELQELKGQMNELIGAVKGIPDTAFHINEHGFYGSIRSIKKRADHINNLAK